MKRLTGHIRPLIVIAAMAISTGASARAGIIVLNVPGATQTVLWGISNDFTLVGTYQLANGYSSSFTYNPSTNTWHYPINVPNEAQTVAGSTNTLGQVVGYYVKPWSPNPPPYAFGFAEWKSGVFSNLYVNDCIDAITPTGINDSSTVGGSCITGVESNGQQIQKAFETYPADVTFSCFGSTATVPNAINNYGQMVGFYVTGGSNIGFISTDQGYCSVLTYPGASSSAATGINDVGDITGVFTKGTGPLQSFILKGNTYTTVTIPGATAVSIGQINNSGWYVGNYLDTSNQQHAFYAHTTP